jgi:hypothetical protein
MSLNTTHTMASKMQVNCYYLGSNQDAPNNTLPVLHYQDVLPQPATEASVTEFLTRNKWEKRVSNCLLSYKRRVNLLTFFRVLGVTLASGTFIPTAMNAMVSFVIARDHIALH